jgi:predicted nucleic acid-binding Zn ribbon protein
LKFPERISRIVPRVLKDMDISGKVRNWQVVDKWEEIVGPNIARHAQAVSVDRENLFVMVDNPVWQSQLFLMKSEILRKVSKLDNRIKDIRFMVSDTPVRRRQREKKN